LKFPHPLFSRLLGTELILAIIRGASSASVPHKICFGVRYRWSIRALNKFVSQNRDTTALSSSLYRQSSTSVKIYAIMRGAWPGRRHRSLPATTVRQAMGIASHVTRLQARKANYTRKMPELHRPISQRFPLRLLWNFLGNGWWFIDLHIDGLPWRYFIDCR